MSACDDLNIIAVILTAAGAAIVGRMIGYVVGHEFGYWLLLRYGHYVGLTTGRVKLGQYLFLRYGGKPHCGRTLCASTRGATDHRSRARDTRATRTALAAAIANVRFGSKADIGARPHNVRFTRKSEHWAAAQFQLVR
jgi:hypothetical protein